jgi:hypothetical protein
MLAMQLSIAAAKSIDAVAAIVVSGYCVVDSPERIQRRGGLGRYVYALCVRICTHRYAGVLAMHCQYTAELICRLGNAANVC